jgi:hypothetical protein
MDRATWLQAAIAEAFEIREAVLHSSCYTKEQMRDVREQAAERINRFRAELASLGVAPTPPAEAPTSQR